MIEVLVKLRCHALLDHGTVTRGINPLCVCLLLFLWLTAIGFLVEKSLWLYCIKELS